MMNYAIVFCGAFALAFGLVESSGAAITSASSVPSPMREFRAAWVATVANIDWPSKPGLPVERQKAELVAILDKSVDLKLNAIVLQMRPACDALYDSKLEPWSDFLTGTMGKAPDPYYDPLSFAVDEAHKRGLELHVWFNPYRAHHPSSRSPISADHISKTHPELVKKYGKYLWLDPGEKAVQDYSLSVILDVVKRYDVDGVHIDDYFYPYKEKDSSGAIIDFPDEPSWQAYVKSGGTLSRPDWRRENVNTFIQRMYDAVKAEKKWVKVGISPFGMWRPGFPPQIKGFDQYSELYADARKWIVKGWLDYWTPQLYWRIDQVSQSYPVLLKWWVEQNNHNRHIWPGNYTSRVADGKTGWAAKEVADQILATRAQAGATGNVHFSMKVFLENRGGLNDLLKAGVYSQPALVPASTWLDDQPPAQPEVTISKGAGGASPSVICQPTGRENVWLWVISTSVGGKWETRILPGGPNNSALTSAVPAEAEAVAVSAVDRCGNMSAPVIASGVITKPKLDFSSHQ